MSKTIKKVASIAAPIAGSIFLPGIGTALGGALGATGAAATGLGTGLLGAGIGAATGGGLEGALTGGVLGGLGGYAGAGGFSGLGQTAPGVAGGGLLTSGAMPTGAALDLATGTGSNLLTAGGLTGSALDMAGAGAAGLPALNISGGSSLPASTFPSYTQPSLVDSLMGGAREAASSFAQHGSTTNTLSQLYQGIQGTEAYKDMARAQQAANQQALNAVSPFQQAGTAAQTQLSSLLGLSGNDNEEILAQLQSTPGYQYRLNQGTQALERSQAARGNLLSGRAVQEAQQLGQGLAEQSYNDYVKQLQQQAGQGLAAGATMSPLYQTGGNISAGQTYAEQNLLNQTLANLLNPVVY